MFFHHVQNMYIVRLKIVDILGILNMPHAILNQVPPLKYIDHVLDDHNQHSLIILVFL